mmetsp:Transcript_154765/g.494878  ORF Transcript_154765/g.494878 Transcript_154765/m.494878 type:complete len:273 (-) Transcript_154765:123-941(-)
MGLLIADGLGNRHIPVAARAEAIKVGFLPELALELCNGHGVARVGLVCLGQGLVWQLVALRNDRGSHEVRAAPCVARVGPLHRRTDTDHLLRDQPGELQQLADHAHVLGDLGRQVVGSTSTHNLDLGVLAVLELMQLRLQRCLGAHDGHRHCEHVPVRRCLHLPGSGSLEVRCSVSSACCRHSKQLGDLILAEVLAIAQVVRIRDLEQHSLQLIAPVSIDAQRDSQPHKLVRICTAEVDPGRCLCVVHRHLGLLLHPISKAEREGWKSRGAM